MSGITDASSAVGASAPPPTPLSTSITLNPGGATFYSVSVASGNLYTNGGAVQISTTTTGGTPPYGGAGNSVHYQGGTAGATAFLTNPGIPNNTVGFSGLNVSGNSVVFYLQNDVTDNVGATATAIFPTNAPGSTIVIQRA